MNERCARWHTIASATAAQVQYGQAADARGNGIATTIKLIRHLGRYQLERVANDGRRTASAQAGARLEVGLRLKDLAVVVLDWCG